ncbi:Eco57I restriction-modification methylase domain-containing protein, partial [Clostridioides difficile]
EETGVSNNFFYVAIGNVPFGEYKVNDREYNRNNFLIHDYFFAKSIDKVRNGGVITFITSSRTMDKKDDSVRRYLSARAEFLGAIRLPNDTFKG